MRKNRPTRRSRINPFSRLFGGKSSASLRKAPRRRDLERLEARQVLSATVSGNPYFEDQWNLDATGQQTEFDPTSPTFDQTLAEVDINVSDVWERLVGGDPTNRVDGSGVQVGIISGGFDLNHLDLEFQQDLGLDTLGAGLGFTADLDVNGTAVAGIIGARNNTEGIVGIAYEADLVPIRAVPDVGDPTPQNVEQALRWRLGLIQDSDGDGIVDGGIGGFADREVIDVYYVSAQVAQGSGQGIQNVRLSDEARTALEVGANFGRGTWTDRDGDGIFDLDEAEALGAIYVVPAGNDNGYGRSFPYDSNISGASSQYNELANSRYTIAVGAVDYDGRYENNATGTTTSFSEMGANVLLVAPSGTSQIDLAADGQLNSGVLTTDLTGEAGANKLPVPFFGEVDGGGEYPGGDYFPDTDYTSAFGGTEAAAAQVTAVVAQMLEVNPNLSRRDVEQILLMSASQTDQFDESWINNPYNYFQDNYVRPFYRYYDLDVADAMGVLDGDSNIDDAVIPNGPFVNIEGPFTDTNTYDPSIVRSYFTNNGDLTIPTFLYGLVEVGGTGPTSPNLVQALSGGTPNDPLFIFGDVGGFTQWGVRDLVAPTNTLEEPLLFTNGAGHTISHGRGFYLEEYGYAHGLLDADLAVELAEKWLPDASIPGDTGLYKPRDITVSTRILDPSGNVLPVQGRADVAVTDTVDFLIPGGISTQGIDTAFYDQFTVPVTATDVTIDNNKLGEVITGGPFYDPDGTLNLPNRKAPGEFLIPIDQSVDFDFLSLEWIEVRSGVASGDIDNLRISIRSPDGTQSELNPYTLPGTDEDGDGILIQRPQFGQGSNLPNYFETVDETAGDVIPEVNSGSLTFVGAGSEILPDGTLVTVGGADNIGGNGQFVDFNDSSNDRFIIGREQPDFVPAGTDPDTNAWTWTTNRHYGELFSVEASNIGDPPGEFPVNEDKWFIVLENWGGAVTLEGFQVTLHGTEATGQRIQGKVGIDDNAQNIDFYNLPTVPGGATATDPTPEQLGDGIFNFNRFIEFGEVVVDPTPAFGQNLGLYPPGLVPEFLLLDGDETVYTVVVDDPTDAVDLSDLPGNVYRTIDPDTGIERSFPVVSKDAYLSANTQDLTSQMADFNPDFGAAYITPSLRRTDGIIAHTQSAPRAFGGVGEAIAPSNATVRVDGTPGTVQNFDYSQESFAAGETIIATQYRVNYDNAGNPGERIATGQFQRFVTGADGNYYFDVESNPAPPDPSVSQEAYDDWFEDFGFTLEYDISIQDQQSRLHDRGYTLDAQADPLSQVSYVGGGTYTVQLFDATGEQNGQTTKVQEVNFLLAVDLAEVQVGVSGTVVRDINGNAINEVAAGTDGTYEGIIVYYDANDNNQRDADELFTTSAADGTYELMIDPAEDTELSIRLDESTYPTDDPLRPIAPLEGDDAELTITNFDPGDSVTGDFFLKPTASVVTGTVWQDTDQNGAFDNGEVAVDGTQIGRDGLTPALFVYHDVNQNNVFDEGTDVAAPVSATGAYQLEFTNPGSYDIRIDLTNSDVSLTFPDDNEGDQRVTVVAEEVLTDINFGVKDLRVFDYGDLPDSYGTTLGSSSEGGARHRVTNTDFYLGNRLPDKELDGQPTINADGDDNDGFDDEDGITLLSSTITAGGTIQFSILAHGGSPKLNAWVDWNDDGVFSSDEQVFDDLGDLGTGVTTTITADVPALIETRDRYAARFRWGSAGLGPIGPANGGEVEDLWLIPEGATITGRVLRDINNNAVFEDAVDTPIPGVRVFIDDNLNGTREPGEPSAVTDTDGRYAFEVVVTAADTPITIRAEESTLPAGTTFLDPIDGIIAELASPNETIVENFLLAPIDRPDQSISGQVVVDADALPGLTGGEDGIAGATVQLLADLDDDPEFEVVTSTTTNVNGAYSFDIANTGDYQVRLLLPNGTTQIITTPSAGDTISVNVGIDEDVNDIDFGVFDRRTTFTRDYGDLRVGGGDNYPTIEADNGASHLVDNVTFLGSLVDPDEGNLTSANATADDLDGVDDEDGVTLLTPQITAGGPIAFNVEANGVPGSVLNAWVDYNDNGVFEEEEKIADNLPLALGEISRLDRVVNADLSTSATFLNTRFRWGTADVGPTGSTNASGQDAIGEVEDHRIPVLMSPSVLIGDYNNSGDVTEADYDFWVSTFGATVPVGTGADGNSDGVVDLIDYTIWREAWEIGLAGGSPALATAPAGDGDGGGGSPALAIAPAGDDAGTGSVTVSAAASVGVGAQSSASALDESLAVTDEERAEGAALDAALLEWSLEDAATSDDEAIDSLLADEPSEEEDEDSPFESVFAF